MSRRLKHSKPSTRLRQLQALRELSDAVAVDMTPLNLCGLPPVCSVRQFLRFGWFLQSCLESVAVPADLPDARWCQPSIVSLGGWLLDTNGTVFSLEAFSGSGNGRTSEQHSYVLAANEWFCAFSVPFGRAFLGSFFAYGGRPQPLGRKLLYVAPDREFLCTEIVNRAAMERDLIMARFSTPSWVWSLGEPVPRR